MASERRDRLQPLIAELEDERARVAKLISQFDHAAQRLAEPTTESLLADARAEGFLNFIQKSGAWYSVGSECIGQGRDNKAAGKYLQLSRQFDKSEVLVSG